MRHNKAYQYPWRYKNTFKVLVDGNEYFSAMLDEIRNAKKYILLEQYLFESGDTAKHFIEELCLAKERSVRVYIILDDYGSSGLNDEDKNRLISAGVELLLYNPTSIFHFGKSLKRDHRKLLVVDNHISFKVTILICPLLLTAKN